MYSYIICADIYCLYLYVDQGGVSCVYTEANLPAPPRPLDASASSTGTTACTTTSTSTISDSARCSAGGGRRRISAGEPAIMFVGIVDILQEYNLFKRCVR
jgi:hypothetical protein